jgi:phosphomannomutase / phosphoglucomutase
MLKEQSAQLIHPWIFRAYDIRGIVDKTLTKENVYDIGCALGTSTLLSGEKCMVIGRDGRLSGPALLKALCDGILSTGCDVIDIGMVPTPLLYYSTHVLHARSGAMLTGSHNPSEYNGLKIVMNRESLTEAGIQDLYRDVIEKRFNKGEGLLSSLHVIDRYIAHMTNEITLTKKMKIVVDCGNGVAGCIAPKLYRQLGCEVIELYCDIDGRFPHHHPDPSQMANLKDLIHEVQKTKADIGLAFDGDGDRLGVVTNQGEVIWADRQLMLFAKDVLLRQPGARIIYDVKCTYHLATLIKKLGGEPIMWKTGHSLIKSKLAETHAVLAGEMSGHIFFKDGWFGFDDALYAGARLLQILAKSSQDSSALFKEIPNSINTPELKIAVNEDEKFLLMEQLINRANFSAAEHITIDGLRVNFEDGWGLVRPSNTTPCLVLRFEAESEVVLTRIQTLFRDLLLAVKPDLVLPF